MKVKDCWGYMKNSTQNNLLLVSIIVPCRNEEKYIGECLDSIIENDFAKDKLEVLVLEGMSEDGSRQVVEKYAGKYPFIKLLENPKKITPCALNIGVKHAKGDVIMRMDAHASYEKNYISKCLKYLKKYGADNVGGVMITLPRNSTFIGKAIVAAVSHPFGVGGSVFRTGSKKPMWVDTVFGGCYRKEVFEKIGLFNENLISSQDMEFNLRLKKAGGKILLVPDIVAYYYARSDFRSFCKNDFRNGLWVVYPFKFTDHMPVSWRHLVPLTFVSSLICSAVLSLFFPLFWWLFFSIIGLYSLTNFYFSCKIAIREKDFKWFFIMPIIFATLHISYGLGSIFGVIKLLLPARRISTNA